MRSISIKFSSTSAVNGKVATVFCFFIFKFTYMHQLRKYLLIPSFYVKFDGRKLVRVKQHDDECRLWCWRMCYTRLFTMLHNIFTFKIASIRDYYWDIQHFFIDFILFYFILFANLRIYEKSSETLPRYDITWCLSFRIVSIYI